MLMRDHLDDNLDRDDEDAARDTPERAARPRRRRRHSLYSTLSRMLVRIGIAVLVVFLFLRFVTCS